MTREDGASSRGTHVLELDFGEDVLEEMLADGDREDEDEGEGEGSVRRLHGPHEREDHQLDERVEVHLHGAHL